MKTRIFVLFIFLFLLLSKAQGQEVIPLNLTLVKDQRTLMIRNMGPQQFGEKVTAENDKAFPALRKVVLTSTDAELHVRNFFESRTSQCTGKFAFGMFPVPGMCYQSEDKRIQFLALTTGVKTEGLLRYSFWSY